MKKYPFNKLTPIWWIDLMEYLRKKKQFEFSDGIREMLEKQGYRFQHEKGKVILTLDKDANL